MNHVIKYAVIFGVIALMIVVPFGTSAVAQDTPELFDQQEGTTAGYMFFDLFLMRPFGFGATLLGSAAFVLALPFSAATRSTGETYQTLVKEPALFTFKRPLGYF